MKILVVEDEIMVAKRLCRLVSELLPTQIETLHHIDCLDEAIIYLSNNNIDLLFLDLNLNDSDGFELLQNMLSRSFPTIVVSANVEQALKAFEYGVIDFVPKPFGRPRIQQAINRALASRNDDSTTGEGKTKLLGVRHLGKTLMLAVTEISHILVAGRYSELVCVDGHRYLHDKKIAQLLLLLPKQFQQIHKSHLVNIDYAKAIISAASGSYLLQLQDKTELAIGRKYLPLLRKNII